MAPKFNVKGPKHAHAVLSVRKSEGAEKEN